MAEDEGPSLPDDPVLLRRIVEESGVWLEWADPVLTAGRRVLDLIDRVESHPKDVRRDVADATLGAYLAAISRPMPMPRIAADLGLAEPDPGAFGSPWTPAKLIHQMDWVERGRALLEPTYLAAFVKLTRPERPTLSPRDARIVELKRTTTLDDKAIARTLEAEGHGKTSPANVRQVWHRKRPRA